jgi:hypothetical protein
VNLTEDDPAVGTLALADRGITFVIADLPPMRFLRQRMPAGRAMSYSSVPVLPTTGCAKRIVAQT